MQEETTDIIDGINYKTIHFYDPKDCYETVKEYCVKYWKSYTKNNSYENYMFGAEAKPWSIGPMLENNGFEGGFSILFIDGEPWSFAGIRKYTDNIALVLCRNFCFYTLKPITHGLLLPFQLNISRKLGYEQAWFTLNSYNFRLYETVWKKLQHDKNEARKNNKIYIQSQECVKTSEDLGVKIINNVEQQVLGWRL